MTPVPSPRRPAADHTLILNTDGAARGNPGPAAIGVVVTDLHGQVVQELGHAIGVATNNEAEYRALLRALECAEQHGAQAIIVQTDSELMARQLQGVYRLRAANLRPLFERAQRAIARFPRVTIRHIPREQNRRADALANQALDGPSNLKSGRMF